MKIYGFDKTALHLTPKAEWAYSETDPLYIIEWADGTYSIRGAEDRYNMTAQDVNDWLEDLADDCLSAEGLKEVGGSQAALSLADMSRASLSSTNLSLADRARANQEAKWQPAADKAVQ